MRRAIGGPRVVHADPSGLLVDADSEVAVYRNRIVMNDFEDRHERNFDVVSSVLGNNAFPFRVRGVLHVQVIMQIPGGLASQQVDIQRFRIRRPWDAELDLGHRHGEPRCKARSMERSRAVTGETMAPDGRGASAIGANVQAIFCMEAVARQSRNVHAPGGLASHGGQISSPRRRRHDKCVIVWPLRSADRSRPPRCFMRKVSPTALNPLKAAAVSAGSTAILYFTYSEPLAFNLIQRPIHLWKTDRGGRGGGLADQFRFVNRHSSPSALKGRTPIL